MSGWSCSGGGVCFVCFCFVLLWLQNDRLQNLHGLAVVLLVFLCSVGVWVGCPHLKTGRSARVAVSPPISTKKININFGWGSCVVVRGWTGGERVRC